MIHVVVESRLDWRAIAQLAAVASFHRLAEDVSRAVPEDGLSLWVVELQQLQRAVAFQRTIQVPQLIVHLGDDGVVGQTLANALRNFVWRSFPRQAFDDFAVGQSYVDFVFRLRSQILEILRAQNVEQLDALLDVCWRRIQLLESGLKCASDELACWKCKHQKTNLSSRRRRLLQRSSASPSSSLPGNGNNKTNESRSSIADLRVMQ